MTCTNISMTTLVVVVAAVRKCLCWQCDCKFWYFDIISEKMCKGWILLLLKCNMWVLYARIDWTLSPVMSIRGTQVDKYAISASKRNNKSKTYKQKLRSSLCGGFTFYKVSYYIPTFGPWSIIILYILICLKSLVIYQTSNLYADRFVWQAE